MNKQEVIDEIENAIPGFILNDFQRGKETGLTYALELVEQLNDPEKPVVPRCVADMIIKRKKQGDSLVGTLVNLGAFGDAQRWIRKGDNGDTFAKAWLYGYEVEKEKLYTVEIPNPNSIGGKLVLFKQQSTGRLILNMLNSSINKPKYLHLTESEIKQDFEWAWQFAKEVDE